MRKPTTQRQPVDPINALTQFLREHKVPVQHHERPNALFREWCPRATVVEDDDEPAPHVKR